MLVFRCFRVPVNTFAMWGACYALAAIGVFVRDVREVVTVFAAANLFLQPIFYRVEQLPEFLRPVIWLNPFTHLTVCFQDVVYYGRFAHPLSWFVLGCLASLAFIFGRRLFARLAPLFGNVL